MFRAQHLRTCAPTVRARVKRCEARAYQTGSLKFVTIGSGAMGIFLSSLLAASTALPPSPLLPSVESSGLYCGGGGSPARPTPPHLAEAAAALSAKGGSVVVTALPVAPASELWHTQGKEEKVMLAPVYPAYGGGEADVVVIATKGERRLCTAASTAMDLLGYGAGGVRSTAKDTPSSTTALDTVKRRGVILCLMNGAGHRQRIKRAIRESHTAEEGPVVVIGTTAMGAVLLPRDLRGALSVDTSSLLGEISVSVEGVTIGVRATGWGDTVIAEPCTAPQSSVTPAGLLAAVLSRSIGASACPSLVSFASPQPLSSDIVSESSLCTPPPYAVLAAAAAATSADKSAVEDGVVWGKLVANLVINPLTAIAKVKNGELASALARAADIARSPGVRDQTWASRDQPWLLSAGENTFDPAFMHDLAAEAVTIARAQGCPLFGQTPPGGAGDEGVARALDSVRLICERTAGNHSSMLSDVLARKAETEIAYLNGQIVQWGAELGISVPANEAVVEAVQRVTKK